MTMGKWSPSSIRIMINYDINVKGACMVESRAEEDYQKR